VALWANCLAPAEYQVAISTIISEAVAISRADLVVETARLFGFDRTGSCVTSAEMSIGGAQLYER
jgi:hypothetical protein